MMAPRAFHVSVAPRSLTHERHPRESGDLVNHWNRCGVLGFRFRGNDVTERGFIPSDQANEPWSAAEHTEKQNALESLLVARFCRKARFHFS